jgi:hypothetical protein
MGKKENKLEISGQFLQCPLMLSIDTYEGCPHECRYCFSSLQYARQNRRTSRSENIRPALLSSWERVLNGEDMKNPMIRYLVRNKHPIQLGTKADPFPAGIERKLKNTRKFVEMSNRHEYPVCINTKNPDAKDMPVDLMADGHYILGVSLASHMPAHIRILEKNTSGPLARIRQIPRGVFKKIVIKWHPFIPNLFASRQGGMTKIHYSRIDGYLDAIAGSADALSIAFLNEAQVWEPQLLQEVGPNAFSELEEIHILSYIKKQAHKRNLQFYTANYRAFSDSPVCCGLDENEFRTHTPWVWGNLIWKLYTGEREFLTVSDLIDAFPKELKEESFASMDVALFSRWARYNAKRMTILDEYIQNFTSNRRMNPANFFAGMFSKVVNGEFRIYFKDYRQEGC